MASRLQRARAQQAPFTNYGMTIACAHNILPAPSSRWNGLTRGMRSSSRRIRLQPLRPRQVVTGQKTARKLQPSVCKLHKRS